MKNINDHSNTVSKALIVWQHTNIVDIINEWNVPLSKWPSDLDNAYNIVFQLNFADDSSPTLSYNCFDFETNEILCSSAVTTWLQSYQTFPVKLKVE